ncbi:uncharacterized protein LOC131435180 [Malaya genurostris]|uniref:uncharacterized protein LOC131435180 n=1 Tax=Malaya genurostris TaxID=325434 RepID=UPI0026F3B51C|nr:uncharacterized protein LOC131435180 [Malaya genurostris]XP_058458786.1 uncharacterized protein LOC131435180 [Malaya genurostris]XP_058458787.1 uncharacterized protein LOC131435180 [Malaya genurostris]
MNRLFPHAEDLNQEEVDYELMIRNQPEEIYSLDLQGKQRRLRNLFRADQTEGRNYRSPINIKDEVNHIEGRITSLEKALSRKVEPKLESRVLHYWYRVKRSIARNDEEKKMRRDLNRKIEKVMKDFQFGPPMSPFKKQINDCIQIAEGAVGTQGQEVTFCFPPGATPSKTQSTATQPIPDKGKGAIPKQPAIPKQQSIPHTEVNEPTMTVFRKDWEEMQNTLAKLTEHIRTGSQTNSFGQTKQSKDPTSNNNIVQASKWTPSKTETHQQRTTTRLTKTTPSYRNQSAESSEEEYEKDSLETFSRDQQNYSYNTDSEHTDYGGDPYFRYSARQRRYPERRFHQRRYETNGRVEKWKLKFTGEPKSMTVENFLYEAKKLAEREEVSKSILLRDIHMLLEGPASDWFFTYVDDFHSWEVFETNIVYRFGNPNKDQGIRSKIQERKQQRGESFIAFVTEIEKLNRMLSRPLSKRRKFEVIWDNMRQHYRSKISIVQVEDLQQLISLNYRIDAADPQLQQLNVEGQFRRPINQIEANSSDGESDNSIPINALRSRYNREASHQMTRTAQQSTSGTRVQRTELPNHRQPTIECWNCQGEGHGWRQCTKPKLVFCYGCGSLGRTIRNCEYCSNPPRPNQSSQGNE